MAEQVYALEKLYEDQEPDLVTDTIPAVLAWLGRNGEGPALSFSVRIGAKPAKEETLRLGYDGRVLEGRCSGTLDRARRMRSRQTADREHVTELAAYGLALARGHLGLDAGPTRDHVPRGVAAGPRRLALLEAGKLKLAAKARLAEGGPDARFEAAVLYHAAARAEQRALLALESPSPEARLASAIERCASLILGFDASAVLDSGWGDVLAASSAVEDRTAAAMRARIDEMLSSFLKRYQDARGKVPAVDAWTEAGCPPGAPRSVQREADRFLKVFPGDAPLWALRSSISTAVTSAPRGNRSIGRSS